MDYNVVNAGISTAYIDTSYFEFEDAKPYTPYNVLNVVVLTMEPGNCLIQSLFTTGKETSLKQVFSRNLEYWHTAFPGRPTQDVHGLSVYRKSLESIEGYSGKQLHILLLKYEGSKSARNPNALPLEQFCGTQFFGTLVVALSLTTSPYSLHGFRISDLQILSNINRLRGNNKPAQMLIPPSFTSSPPISVSLKEEQKLPAARVPPRTGARAELSRPLEESFYEMSSDTFFMYRYKTLYCPHTSAKHDWNSCLYAHWVYDYRRAPDANYYIAEMCPLVAPDRGGVCKDGDKCGYSHSPLEKLYHPSRYKVFPCESLRKNSPCTRKYACAFYHNAKEQRNPDTLKVTDPPFQPFLSYAEPRVTCINFAVNYIDALIAHMTSLEESKKGKEETSKKPLQPEFEWKSVNLQRPTDFDSIETRSERKVASEKSPSSEGPSSAPKDYFALFSKEDPGKQVRSTGVTSVTSEGVSGKIFIDGQYIDSAEALDLVDDIGSSEARMTLICESVCGSDSCNIPSPCKKK